MFKLVVLSLVVAAGSAGISHAAVTRTPFQTNNSAVVTVGERCGAGMWRSGLDNRCRPLGVYANNQGTVAECPAGWHIGPRGGACWPNR